TKSYSAILNRVLPIIKFVLNYFENSKEFYKNNRFLLFYINSGWSKLNDYYALINKSPAYVTAVVLNLTKKWQYFKDQ
ncbi:hypothetical protein DL98DRAFT_438361, partial [Cadophora sp. DSE1049]